MNIIHTYFPFPIDQQTWELNHASLRKAAIARHQAEANLPPSSNIPPSSPYIADNTLFHILSFSINDRQHHFPNKAQLNSLILLTPKPPTSFLKQTEFQSI